MSNGKTVVLTGGSSGIGFSILNRLISEGYTIINIDKVSAGVPEVVEFIGSISDDNFIKNSVQVINGRFSKLFALINNAGISQKGKQLHDLSFEDMEDVLKVNLISAIKLTSLILPMIIRNGKGRIINIASVIGKVGGLNSEVYAASKAGLIGFTKSLSLSYAKFGIRANVILPGYIDTPLIKKAAESSGDPDNYYKDLISRHPVGRLGRAEEIASIVSFLLSDESDFINGAEIAIDGGYLSK